jgi:hypothetical protein
MSQSTPAAPMTSTERYSLVRHTMLAAFKTPGDVQAFEKAVHDVSQAWQADVQVVHETSYSDGAEGVMA